MFRISFFLFTLVLSGCNANSDELNNIRTLNGLQYTNTTHIRHSHHCQDTSVDDTCATITIRMPELLKTPTQTTPEKINQIITERHLTYPRNNAAPATGIHAYITEFLNEYTQFIKENQQLSGAWQLNKHIQIIAYKEGILSLKDTENGYNGGAHGFSNTKYISYDITQHKPIKLDRLFISNYHSKLNQVGEKAFRAARGLADEQSLQKAGFEFENDRFALNNNFAITEQGLVFFFNSYEIAAYVAGSTELLIPYHEISTLIPKDSLLATYVNS